MTKRKVNDKIVGSSKQTQKTISNNLIKMIKKYQKHLQIQENIKFGRRARNISFVFASSKPKNLAQFILKEANK